MVNQNSTTGNISIVPNQGTVNPQANPCPNCGYCPHCGRGGYQTYPYPYYPQYPWVTYTYTNSDNPYQDPNRHIALNQEG